MQYSSGRACCSVPVGGIVSIVVLFLDPELPLSETEIYLSQFHEMTRLKLLSSGYDRCCQGYQQRICPFSSRRNTSIFLETLTDWGHLTNSIKARHSLIFSSSVSDILLFFDEKDLHLFLNDVRQDKWLLASISTRSPPEIRDSNSKLN